MKSLNLRGLAELMGFLGVIASLVFVALEIRQNTNIVRGATIQAFADQSSQFSLALAQDADLRAAYIAKDDPDIGPDKKAALGAFYTGLMRILENRVMQAKIGVIAPEDLDSFGSKSVTYRTPYFRTFWERTKEQYSSELQHYVESEILSLPMLTPLADQ